MRLQSLVIRLAWAGLVTLGPIQNNLAAPLSAPPVARVVTDGDITQPDDLIVTLALGREERIADIRLREDGQDTSLLGHFQVETAERGATRIRLQPALDFDRLKDLKATLGVLVAGGDGALRELALPIVVEPLAALAAPLEARLALSTEVAATVPVLPLGNVGNARIAWINRVGETGNVPLAYSLVGGPDGGQLAVEQQPVAARPGETLVYEIGRELTPGGKRISQRLGLTPASLADLNRDLDAVLEIDPDTALPRLTFSVATAANLEVEDLLLAGRSVGTQFEVSRTADAAVFNLKPGQSLGGAASDNENRLLTVQKRLDGKTVLTQTVNIGTGKASPPGGTTAESSSAPLPGRPVRPTGKAAEASDQPAAAPAPLIINNRFPPAEPPRAVERPARRANRFAGLGPVTRFEYDANGNRTKITDPLGRITAYAYDRLNRLVTQTDPAAGVTAYGYDGQNRLATVTDPRRLVTRYTVDGLGNLTSLNSPDSGIGTASYNAAGLAVSRSDAAGQSTAYAYDGLGRLTRATYQDGSRTDYAYDQGANGAGRLTRIDESGPDGKVVRSQRLEYDAQGRMTRDTRNIAGVEFTIAYRYAQGRLTGLTYPSGRSLAYTYDGAGRISQISLTDQGQTQILASNIAYRPFGGIISYTNGAGRTLTRRYDSDGRLVGFDAGGQPWQMSVDAASRITAISSAGNPPAAGAYTYDTLDRLTQAVLPGATQTYAYDANGNRTSAGVAGGTAQSYAIAPTSNRLTAIDGIAVNHDANGSILGDGTRQYAYDPRGRLTRAILDGATTRFEVNALGQRVRKSNDKEDRVFVYDLAGRIIGETAPDGSNARDYVWLGDLPLAVVQ